MKEHNPNRYQLKLFCPSGVNPNKKGKVYQKVINHKKLSKSSHNRFHSRMNLYNQA